MVGPLLLALGKAALFLALAYLVGTRVMPWILRMVSRQGSSELFLLAVVATALLTAFVSSAVFGLSLALGAFVAGIIVSESDVSYQAAAEVIPFRDLFAVLFFVSVGMLVDPEALLASAPTVALLVLIAVAGKGLVIAVLGRGFGMPIALRPPPRWRDGPGGEFSFIVASDAFALEHHRRRGLQPHPRHGRREHPLDAARDAGLATPRPLRRAAHRRTVAPGDRPPGMRPMSRTEGRARARRRRGPSLDRGPWRGSGGPGRGAGGAQPGLPLRGDRPRPAQARGRRPEPGP